MKEQLISITTAKLAKDIGFDWNKVTKNKQIIKLLKEREKIEKAIFSIDKDALIKYELERLQLI